MASDFTFEAKARADVGKGASRRLRRLEGELPGIVYGGDQEPQPISLNHDDLLHALEDERFYTHVLTLKIDGKGEEVVLKDLQRHPAKPKLIHADFMRIVKGHAITMSVPLHFINEDKCKGVKLQGGIVNHSMTELEIRCLPKDLPEFIEVDMAECEVGDHIHISDLKLPAGVESVELMHGPEHDQSIASVIKPRGVVEAEGEEGEAGEEGGEAEGEEGGE